MCIRGEELQDVQLGLDWSLQGLYIFYRLSAFPKISSCSKPSFFVLMVLLVTVEEVYDLYVMI